jgi:hypothetical protein
MTPKHNQVRYLISGEVKKRLALYALESERQMQHIVADAMKLYIKNPTAEFPAVLGKTGKQLSCAVHENGVPKDLFELFMNSCDNSGVSYAPALSWAIDMTLNNLNK